MKPNEFLSKIRKKLHQIPEIAGNEQKTSEMIKSLLEKFSPNELITGICGYGIAAVYNSQKPGSTIVLRAEMDALPILEKNNFNYTSKNPGISHACGHDGHMTILLGVASYLHNHPDEIKGKIILLFQPSEENAQGAQKITKSLFYQHIKPDYIYALHNLPGYSQGDLVIKNGVFAIASKGLVVKLIGETAHAGHPEQGNNPVFAIKNILEKINTLSDLYYEQDKQSMITIIYIKIGEIAFGTSPGDATIMATLRAPSNYRLTQMGNQLINYISKTAESYNLEYSVDWKEKFHVTKNNTNAVKILKKAAKNKNIKIINIRQPLSWTEDFSYFLEKTPGAIFGLGAGVNHASLHSQNYDFPDNILCYGLDIYIQLIREINSYYNQG